MKLLLMGGWEMSHLNDALARVIVEMIKREWPQQWPTLLAELSDACSRGHRHTQIVLHVFLRLAEDVAILQVTLKIYYRFIYYAIDICGQWCGVMMKLVALMSWPIRATPHPSTSADSVWTS